MRKPLTWLQRHPGAAIAAAYGIGIMAIIVILVFGPR